jgi:hypothetical protein
VADAINPPTTVPIAAPIAVPIPGKIEPINAPIYAPTSPPATPDAPETTLIPASFLKLSYVMLPLQYYLNTKATSTAIPTTHSVIAALLVIALITAPLPA